MADFEKVARMENRDKTLNNKPDECLMRITTDIAIKPASELECENIEGALTNRCWFI
jgi:hypothetical protein